MYQLIFTKLKTSFLLHTYFFLILESSVSKNAAYGPVQSTILASEML